MSVRQDLPEGSVLVPGLVGQAVGVALLALEPSLIAWLTPSSSCLWRASRSLWRPRSSVTSPTRGGSEGQLGRFRFVGDLGLITGPLVVSASSKGLGRAMAFGFVALVLTTTALVSWRLLPGRSAQWMRARTRRDGRWATSH